MVSILKEVVQCIVLYYITIQTTGWFDMDCQGDTAD